MLVCFAELTSPVSAVLVGFAELTRLISAVQVSFAELIRFGSPLLAAEKDSRAYSGVKACLFTQK